MYLTILSCLPGMLGLLVAAVYAYRESQMCIKENVQTKAGERAKLYMAEMRRLEAADQEEQLRHASRLASRPRNLQSTTEQTLLGEQLDRAAMNRAFNRRDMIELAQ
jgi:hypothetical protein